MIDVAFRIIRIIQFGQWSLGPRLILAIFFVQQLDQTNMLEGPHLIVHHAAVIVIPIDLRNGERQSVADPGVVTRKAFRPAGEVPGLFSLAARRRLLILDR